MLSFIEHMEGAFAVDEVEAMAVTKALNIAVDSSLTGLVVESNSTMVIKGLSSHANDLSTFGNVLLAAKRLFPTANVISWTKYSMQLLYLVTW